MCSSDLLFRGRGGIYLRDSRWIDASLIQRRSEQGVRRANAQDWTFFLGQTCHCGQQQREFPATYGVGHNLRHRARRPAAPGQKRVQHSEACRNAGGDGLMLRVLQVFRAQPHVIAHDGMARG